MRATDFDGMLGGSPCFCGSGKLYDACHRQWTYKHPQEISIDQDKFLHAAKVCPVPINGSPCGNSTIKSHSIQRRGPLAAISESGHVLTFSTGPNTKRKIFEALNFNRVSTLRASTFPGLCAQHDQESFSDTDQLLHDPTYRNALRLAIRSTLYEAVVHTYSSMFLSWLVKVPKFSFPFDQTAMVPEIENMRYGSAYTWDLLRTLQLIEKRSSVRKFLFYAAVLDTALPFTSSGCFCIELDFQGNRLQAFSEVGQFAYAQMTALPQSNGTTFLSVSSVDDQNPLASRKFIQSIRKVKEAELATAALKSSLNHSENTYFKPSFIDSLTDNARKELLERFDEGDFIMVGQEKPANMLSAPLSVQLHANVLKRNSNVHIH